jgi:hypothetical protein
MYQFSQGAIFAMGGRIHMNARRKLLSLCFLAFQVPATALCQDQLHLITTISGDSTGDEFSVVAGVGDVNGDGYDDFVVGAPGGNYAKLFFGGPAFDTTHYVKLVGEQTGSRFGWSVAGGDINGDGYSDIVIGAPHYTIGGYPSGVAEAGKVYVYFGGVKFDTIPDLTFSPGSWYYLFGQSICVAEDVNGDGFKDIVVGAPNDDIDAHGRAYIYYGGSPMADTPAVILNGEETFDSFGESVAGVGDVNKDGFGDLLIGAPQQLKYPYSGEAYLIYGGQNISLVHSTLFVGDSSAHGAFGRVVAGLGDINGDSIPDFGIMALNKVNIYRGGIQIDTIPNLTIYPGRDFGFIGGLGDLNKDGFDDFVAVSDSTRIYFGSLISDTIPSMTLSWATPVCALGRIDSSKYLDIACAVGGGWDPKGKIYIYSYGSPDNVGEESLKPPMHFKLSQNYPNPFNPVTRIQYTVNSRQTVSLKVYDLLGREIRTLVDGAKNPGTYEVQFNGSHLASGVYFYRLKTKIGVLQKKMILLR